MREKKRVVLWLCLAAALLLASILTAAVLLCGLREQPVGGVTAQPALPRPAASTSEPTPEQPPEPTAEPAPEPTPDPAAQEALRAACLETPVKRDEAESRARLEELGQYDSRYLYVLENIDSYPEEMLFELAYNPELLEFALDFMRDFVRLPVFSESERNGETPLLMQYDPRWGYQIYGSGELAFTGCGPTCLSMAALHFTGNAEATPDAVARWALENDYYVSGSGTKWLMFSEGAADWGLSSRELPLWKGSVDAALDAGQWVILCMDEGDFTLFGHFIILCGRETDGYRVLDPFSRARSGEIWSYERLESQIANLWAIGEAEEIAEDTAEITE